MFNSIFDLDISCMFCYLTYLKDISKCFVWCWNKKIAFIVVDERYCDLKVCIT